MFFKKTTVKFVIKSKLFHDLRLLSIKNRGEVILFHSSISSTFLERAVYEVLNFF